MRNKVKIGLLLIACLSILLLISCKESSKNTIDVFHKDKKLSLQTLEEVNLILNKYKDNYEISYYDILDSVNISLIRKYNLPETHFPFAVVINGKYSAHIQNIKIDFVQFPLFMQGIGRHQGNWTLKDLKAALKDNSILIEENTLPVAKNEDSEEEEPCEE